MRLPTTEKELVGWANDLISICRVSQGQRAGAYRTYGQWIETGRPAGGLGPANLLSAHIDRLQAHLFSPTDLKFDIDFENFYSKTTLAQGAMASRILSREWERRNIDTCFAAGVKEALKYGAAIHKILLHNNGSDENAPYTVDSRIVMPWNFGVYNESVNGLSYQEAMCETAYINRHEAWRRIAHLSDAEKLFKSIIANSNKDAGSGSQTSFMHQVLSTAVLDVNLTNATSPMPGGVVQLSNDPNSVTMGPQVAADLIPMHELWVKDDRTGDYTTIQLIEPNILIAPRMKHTNLFCPDTLCYSLIQPNPLEGYFWGRSEIADLMTLQNLLNDTLDNTDRLYKAQFDKILAFEGYDGLADEVYDQSRAAGYMNMPQGATVSDVTPKLPEQCLTYIQLIETLFDRVAGFPNVLSGKGEKGVRAGDHADVLLRMASPKLRNAALLVERQCATSGDIVLAAMEAKDPRVFWIGAESDSGTDFHLAQLPDDRRVTVDSHSSSPIYVEDHQQLVFAGIKDQIVGPEYAIKHLPFPDKDAAIQELRDRQQAQAQLLKEHPELLTQGQGGGKKK